MWRLKQFMPNKEGGGTLEGKHVDVGDLKLQVRSVIAQGGFSSVYLVRDSATGKTYALKHIICNDMESVELVKKEVSVMKALRGHPNVVTLHGQVVYDLGRTKECFLVMEYCHKMLAHVLDNRGAGFYDEKQILLMFLDICNAVYAMHCQSPPIAHRDLKVENVLMGPDGLWKLCDFGSISINHKHFDTPEEMGLEEDYIRKFTTPSYRAPEMWDLYQKELISEKVDIWALGCLLYRIAYLKSAFDGESKLQILNCNYRIPDAPRYSTAISGLIKDMLNVSPEARPDVMQVWQRVNEALPPDCRKGHPDKAPLGHLPSISQKHHNAGGTIEGARVSSSTSSATSLFPSKEVEQRPPETGLLNNHSAKGAFWSTQYAQNSNSDESTLRQEKGGGKSKHSTPVRSGSPPVLTRYLNNSPPKDAGSPPGKSSVAGVTRQFQALPQSAKSKDSGDREVEQHEPRHSAGWQLEEEQARTVASNRQKHTVTERAVSASDSHFAAFEAESSQSAVQSGSYEQMKAEVDRLNIALKQALADKSIIASKFEKLTAICRSQRQEIQDLKSGFNSGLAKNPQLQQQSPSSRAGASQTLEQAIESQSGTIWDLQEGLSLNTVNQQNSWAAFGDSPHHSNFSSPSQRHSTRTSTDSVFMASGIMADRGVREQETRSSNPGGETWRMPQDRTPPVGNAPFGTNTHSPHMSAQTISGTLEPTTRVQPAGWAGF